MADAPPPLVQGEHVLEDGWLVVVWAAYEHYAEFTAYEVTGLEAAPDGATPAVRYYERAGADTSMDTVTTLAEAATYVRGTVKWDGCSHLYFGDETEHDGYLHLCGKRHFDRLTRLLAWVWARAAQDVPGFDRGVAS